MIDGLHHEVDPGTSSWFLVEPFTPLPPGRIACPRVMSPEIAELTDKLHEPMSADDSKALCSRHQSALALIVEPRHRDGSVTG
jgi:hypothetical protein